MRDDGPLPVILFLMISCTLLVTCYLMSQAQIPTTQGIRSLASAGDTTCFSYLGTPQEC